MTEKPPQALAPLYAAMVEAGVRYQPWLGLPLEADTCFLCARTLDSANRTIEDVYPRWLQQDLRTMPDRAARPLLLPNSSSIALSSVLVPACIECNGTQLSQLEARVSRAFRTGTAAVRQLSECDLRQWCSKIAYGSRVNDMRLDFDRRNPQAGKLATADAIEGLSNLHWLLQEVRDVVRISPGHSTFWIYEAETINCASCDWDVALPVGWPNVVMFKHRGSVVLGAVDDRGGLAQLRHHEAFIAADQLTLHKEQVRALHAIVVATAASLASADYPIRFGVSDSRVWIERLPPAEVTAADEGGPESVASGLLATLIAQPLEAIQDMGGATGYLVLPDGSPRNMTHSC